MTIEKFELRFNPIDNFEMTKENENELKVSGYVNKSNQWSEELGTRSKFVERIMPGTFKRALQRGNEVHFYAEHDPTKILASTRNDSLTLREDDKGLFMEARISPTSWGKDYHTLIKDGIIQNMSFGMKVLKDDWKKRSDGINERTISDLYLAEVSAVRNPAYAQSTISSRGIDLVEDVEPGEEKQEPNQVEQRELTPQEKLTNKKSELYSYRKMVELFGSTDEYVQKIKSTEGEIRKMEALLEKQSAPVEAEKQEERAVITTTQPGSLAKEITLLNSIIEVAEQNSAIAQMANMIKVKGQSQLVADIAMSPAGIVAEWANVPTQDPNFKSVTFNPKRMASAIEMSQNVLNDTGIDLKEHATELLSYRILNGFEQQMFNTGDADGSAGFQNIFLHNNGTTKIEDIETISNIGTANVYMDFAKAIAGLSKQPQMMVGAAWAIADPEAVAAITDPYGFSILNYKGSQDNPGSIGTILGLPAYVVAEGFSDNKATAVLINSSRSYTITMSDDTAVTPIKGDTTQELRKAVVFLGECYSDGRIVNPRGIKIVKHA